MGLILQCLTYIFHENPIQNGLLPTLESLLNIKVALGQRGVRCPRAMWGSSCLVVDDLLSAFLVWLLSMICCLVEWPLCLFVCLFVCWLGLLIWFKGIMSQWLYITWVMSYNSCYNEGGVYMSHDHSLTLPESMIPILEMYWDEIDSQVRIAKMEWMMLLHGCTTWRDVLLFETWQDIRLRDVMTSEWCMNQHRQYQR